MNFSTKYLLSSTLFLLSTLYAPPSITGACGGSTGNQLFVFCFAKILSEKLGYSIRFNPIPEFPETYKYPTSVPLDKRYNNKLLRGHVVDFDELTKTKANLFLEGFFIRYEYYKPYRDRIRNEWLRMDQPVQPHPNPNDVVVHVRVCPPPHHPQFYLPFSYYEAALAQIEYENLYICVDLPEDPYVVTFLKKFERYNPTIMEHESIQENDAKMRDFRFMMSFNKIVIAQSSYSWWAAYLSDAQEIYAPKPLDRGWMGPERPEIKIACVDEPGWKYVPCIIGKRPWEK